MEVRTPDDLGRRDLLDVPVGLTQTACQPHGEPGDLGIPSGSMVIYERDRMPCVEPGRP